MAVIKSSDDNIQEGEIIEASISPTPASDPVDLTGLINSHLNQIENMRTQLSKYREMLDSIFANDSTYQAHDAAVKEASRVRSATKKQILSQSQAADLQSKINDTRSHIKELNADLSDYLQDYARTTGLTSIETETGEVRQIVYTAKLVKIGG